ncbi:hypothetical protein AYO38_07825 [bacterium SCGC AG-212-C10]|nr:hypothetical protein AYO38_07825 [bacterium SCGC AG-212-C10]
MAEGDGIDWVLHWRDANGVTGERPIDDAFTIGRSSACDVVFESQSVSRTHLRFGLSAGGRAVVEDLGSTSGTFLNGAKVTSSFVGLGDEVRAGDYTLWVTPPENPAPRVVRRATPANDPSATVAVAAFESPGLVAAADVPTATEQFTPPRPATSPFDEPTTRTPTAVRTATSWDVPGQRGAPPAAVLGHSPFRAGQARAAFAQLALVFAIASAVFVFLAAFNRVATVTDVLDGHDVAVGTIEDADSLLSLAVGIQFFAAPVLLAIFWLLWVARAHKNLSALTTRPLGFGHTAAVLWWFVPVVNIVQGLRIVREISRESNAGRRDSVLPILCWFFAIIGAGIATAGYALPGETLREIRRADIVIMAGMPLLILAWLLFIVYIQRTVSAQKRRARELGLVG